MRERLLIRTLLELVDTMTVDYDVMEFLYVLCDRTVEVVDVDAAGVMWVSTGGEPEVAAASSADMHELEQLQVDQRQGPCIDALRLARPVQAGDLAADIRWPPYTAAAVASGFRSLQTHPLRAPGGGVIGALNVVRGVAEGFTDDDTDVIGGLADMAAVGVVHARALSDAERRIGHLQRALEKRSVVDQATAVLAERLDIDRGASFDYLRRYARSNNQQLRDLAQRFLAGEIDADVVTRSS